MMISACYDLTFVTGACGGSMACSTCHMIFEPEVYKQLPPPSEAEEDTLELAVDPTVTYVMPQS